MRTEENWKKRIFPEILNEFSLRIKTVLKDIPELILPNVESTFIFGKSKTGKTIHACQMLIAERRNLYFSENVNFEACIFISVPEFFQSIKYAYEKKISDTEILDQYTKAHLLILDDFGVEKTSDWTLNLLYLLINRRYENMSKTIITSNFTLKELSKKLEDSRITSRIEQTYKIKEFK